MCTQRILRSKIQKIRESYGARGAPASAAAGRAGAGAARTRMRGPLAPGPVTQPPFAATAELTLSSNSTPLLSNRRPGRNGNKFLSYSKK